MIIHLRIFSFVHSMRSSSWNVWCRNFAMMIFLSFKTHTFRLRRTFLMLLKFLIETSVLKLFFVYFSKSFLNCFHKLVFWKSESIHFLIITSIKAILFSSLTNLILMFIAEIRSMRWESKKDSSREVMRVKIILRIF